MKKRKIMLIGLIFIFCIANLDGVSCFESLNLENGNILFVGGSGSGNYSTIQDAIDNTTDGDTVFVYNGIYQLSSEIIINKSVTLIGENRDDTRIIPSDTETNQVMMIHSDGVTITQFTFKNIIILNINDYVTIGNNTFIINIYNLQSGKNGIINSKGSYNVFQENTLILVNRTGSNRPYNGLDINDSYSKISNNVITGAIIGLSLTGKNNTISRNIFEENNNGIEIICPFTDEVNHIINNNFLNNENHAEFGILIKDPFFTLIGKLFSYGGIPPQEWNHNYWDTHTTDDAKIINGNLDVFPSKILGFDLRTLYPIHIPWREVDPNPSFTPI